MDWKRQHNAYVLSSEWGVDLASTIVQGPEPIEETEAQPSFRYVEYRRVLATIPIRPSPVLVFLVYPSWFPRAITVSLIVGIIVYHLF